MKKLIFVLLLSSISIKSTDIENGNGNGQGYVFNKPFGPAYNLSSQAAPSDKSSAKMGLETPIELASESPGLSGTQTSTSVKSSNW